MTLRRLFLAGLPILFGLGLIIAWQVRNRHGFERIPIIILQETGFLGVEAHVNGRRILMVLDTAANLTSFDVSLIEELELPKIERTGMSFRGNAISMDVQTAHIEELKLGNVIYRGDFCFVDLSTANQGIEASGDQQAIRGLLGADLLTEWKARIDYGEQCILIRGK